MQVRETPKNLLTGIFLLNFSVIFMIFFDSFRLSGSMWDTLSQNMWSKFLDSQQTEETFKKKMKLWRYLYVSIKVFIKILNPIFLYE